MTEVINPTTSGIFNLPPHMGVRQKREREASSDPQYTAPADPAAKRRPTNSARRSEQFNRQLQDILADLKRLPSDLGAKTAKEIMEQLQDDQVDDAAMLERINAAVRELQPSLQAATPVEGDLADKIAALSSTREQIGATMQKLQKLATTVLNSLVTGSDDVAAVQRNKDDSERLHVINHTLKTMLARAESIESGIQNQFREYNVKNQKVKTTLAAEQLLQQRFNPKTHPQFAKLDFNNLESLSPEDRAAVEELKKMLPALDELELKISTGWSSQEEFDDHLRAIKEVRTFLQDSNARDNMLLQNALTGAMMTYQIISAMLALVSKVIEQIIQRTARS